MCQAGLLSLLPLQGGWSFLFYLFIYLSLLSPACPLLGSSGRFSITEYRPTFYN